MRTRIELNRRAIGELLKGPEITRDLQRRGYAVAAAAGAGHTVETWVGRNRVRVTVATATADAAAHEARHHTLVPAVQAGR